MTKFWELLAESVIIQAILAIGLLSGILYLYVSGREVPQILMDAFMVILGYYFGTKSQQAVIKALKK
jgi:hypothetical protein